MGLKATSEKVNSLESRLSLLEQMVASSATSSQPNFDQALQTLGGEQAGLSPSAILALTNNIYSSILDSFRSLGLVVEQGIVKAQKLVANILQADKLAINATPKQGDPTIGSAQINAGELNTYIINNQISSTAKIFVTPEQPVALGICERNATTTTLSDGTERPQGFKVCTNVSSNQIITFSWWIVETAQDGAAGQTTSSPEATPTVTPTPSPEETPTVTPTPSPETTPSPEPTVTPTPSPEETPTVTPTSSPETTPSPEPIVTPTPSPEATPTE